MHKLLNNMIRIICKDYEEYLVPSNRTMRFDKDFNTLELSISTYHDNKFIENTLEACRYLIKNEKDIINQLEKEKIKISLESEFEELDKLSPPNRKKGDCKKQVNHKSMAEDCFIYQVNTDKANKNEHLKRLNLLLKEKFSSKNELPKKFLPQMINNFKNVFKNKNIIICICNDRYFNSHSFEVAYEIIENNSLPTMKIVIDKTGIIKVLGHEEKWELTEENSSPLVFKRNRKEQLQKVWHDYYDKSKNEASKNSLPNEEQKQQQQNITTQALLEPNEKNNILPAKDKSPVSNLMASLAKINPSLSRALNENSAIQGLIASMLEEMATKGLITINNNEEQADNRNTINNRFGYK